MNLIQITEASSTPTKNNDSKIAVGIDLGTTNSLVSIVENGVPIIINKIIPSIVSYTDNGEVIVGKAIGRQIFSSIKRLMGKGRADIKNFKNISKYEVVDSNDNSINFKAGDKIISPEEISSEILKYIKKTAEDYLNRPLEKAVITVPAYFDDAARNATKLAAKLAGLDVIRLINEPTAAALAYGLDEDKEGKYIIYDLGGGTFDLSLLNMQKGVFQVIATSGDANFGGDDLDEKILEFMLANVEFKEFESASLLKAALLQAREIKEKLSKNQAASTTLTLQNSQKEITITRKEYEDLISPSIEYSIKLLQKMMNDSGISAKEIEGIVLVGGSTRIPLIKEKLREKFSFKIFDDLDPDIIVARGAAVQANALTNGSDHLLLDVVPLSLGIEVMGGVFERIINKNSPIPIVSEQEFTTYEDGQTAIIIHVLQGERELSKDCRSLAKFIINNISPMKAGEARISIIFKIDVDGVLTIEAKDKQTNIVQKVEVKPSYGMSIEKIEEMLRASYENAKLDINQKAAVEAALSGKRLIKELSKIVDKDAKLISADECLEIKKQISNLEASISENDAINIQTQITKLENISENFVNRRTNFYLRKALAGKSIDQVENLFDK